VNESDKPDNQPVDEIADLLATAAPGVEDAMQQFEGVERYYYGAVFATRMPEATVTGAAIPHALQDEA
jgi:hypothetical protein